MCTETFTFSFGHYCLDSLLGINKWPAFQASESRLGQIMMTFDATVSLFQTIGDLGRGMHEVLSVHPHYRCGPPSKQARAGWLR